MRMWRKKRKGHGHAYGGPVKHLSIKEYFDKKANETNTRRDFDQPEAPQKRKTYRITYIYALCDPETGTARYVGKSNYPQRRYQQHIEDSHGAKAHWIKHLVDKGTPPVLKILEECRYEEWESRERHWIRELKRTQELFNKTAGGDQSFKYDIGIPRRDTPESSAPQ